MQAGTRRWIQVFLAAMLLLAGARTLWIFLQRRGPPPPARQAVLPARTLNPDHFVHLPRAYLSDLGSARRMQGSTVWIRDGYRYAHYPFDTRARRTREIADPPLLPSIQKITVRSVTSEPTPRKGVDEINFVFELPGASPPERSLTIGHCYRRGQACRFYVDEMFFLKDPRELYSHWKPEIWQAIESRQIKEGMSETQMSFALGYGRLLPKETAEAGGDRVVEFRPPGSAARWVTFGADGNARRIHAPR